MNQLKEARDPVSSGHGLGIGILYRPYSVCSKPRDAVFDKCCAEGRPGGRTAGWERAQVEILLGGFGDGSDIQGRSPSHLLRGWFPVRGTGKRGGDRSLNRLRGAFLNRYLLETTGCGSALFDFDNDGDLDAYLVNGCQLEEASKGQELTNHLYRNEGDRSFSEVTEGSGAGQVGWGQAVCAGDYDNDGWVDVYVANDSSPSALYRNNQDGTFADIGTLAGCSYSQHGRPQAGMGVTAADFNRDGHLDIFKTNFAGQPANLYRNRGESQFEEASFSSGIAANTRWLGWGCGFLDLDLDRDGWVDIFQVNGHVYPEVNQLEGEARYKQPKVVYRNQGDGSFEDVTARAGVAVQIPQAGRGAAFGDYDGDGDIDVLVNNVHEVANLYENVSLNSNHWISVCLRGVVSNRSGIGARVRCGVGECELVDEVRSGGSYYSQNDLRVYFGLGAAQRVDWLEVTWPGGGVDRLENVPVDQFLEIHEGRGLQTQRPARSER